MKIPPAIKATQVALAIALMVVISLPLSYFLLGYGRLSIILQTEAEANAVYATQIINANPEYWPFEEVRLQEFLYRHLIPPEHEIRRISKLTGAIVAQTPDKVRSPFITRSHDLYESGNLAAKLDIIRSLRPLLWETLLVGICGCFLVAAVFFPLKKFVIEPREEAEKALREREQFLASVFDSIQDGLVVMDRDFNILKVNSTTEQRLAHAMPLVGQKCYSRHGLTEPCEDCPCVRVLETGETGYQMKEVTRPGGIREWVEIFAFPLQDLGSGQINGVLEYVRIITARKQAEEALRQARQEWEEIFQAIGHPTMILDPELGIIDANRATLAALGKTMPEIRGRKCYEFFHPGKDHYPAECPLEKLHTSGRLETMEMEVEALEGTYLVSCTPMLDAQGRLERVIHIVTDVTERRRAERALRASEENYRLLVKQIPALVFKGYADWSIDCFDHKIETLTGYSNDDFESRRVKWSDLILEEDLPGAKAKFLEALKGTGTYVREYRIRQKSGEVIWVHVQGQIFSDAAGKIDHISGVIFDVTGRKQAEEELRKERDLSLSIMESLPGVFYLIDEQGRLTRWNKNLEEISQYTGLEIFDLHSQDFFAGLDKQRIGEILQTAFTTGEAHIEAELISKDGGKTPYFFTGRRIIMEGRPHLVGMGQDISERRQMEEALKESEKRFRDIADNAMEWIWEVDAEGSFTYSSSIVEKLLGYKPEELINQHFYDLFHPEDRQGLKDEAFELFAAKLSPREFISRNLHKDGRSVWLLTNGIAILDDQGNLMGYRGANTDITERLQAEKALQASERFLSSVFASIQDTITILDSDLNIIRVNPARERAFPKEMPLVGKKCYEVLHGTSQPCEDCSALRTLETGRPNEKIVTYNPADGAGLGYINLSTFPLMDEASGEVTGVVEVGRDITERKRAEEALIASEANYRTIFNAVNDPLFVHDALTGEILDVNRKTLEVFGYSFQELRNLGVEAISLGEPPYTQKEAREWIRKAAAGEPQLFNWQGRDKSGRQYWLEINLKRATIGNNECVLAVARDITQRREVEEELARRKVEFEAIFNSMTDAVVFTDTQRRVITANPAFLAMFGYSLEEIREETTAFLYKTRAEYEELGRIRYHVGAQTEQSIFEMQYRRKDGSLVDCETMGTLVNDCQGRTIGYMGLHRDISERKRAEEALMASEANYRTIFNAVNDGIFVHDARTGAILDVNQNVLQFSHRSMEEIKGLNIEDITRGESPYTQEEALAWIQKAAAGEPQLFRWRGRNSYGRLCWWEMNLKRVSLGDKECVLAVARNITGRLLAQEALQESNKRYQSLFEDSPISIWQMDFSEVMAYLHNLQNSGVQDLRTYLQAHPEAVALCTDLTKIIDANKATLKMYGAESKEDLLQGLPGTFIDKEHQVFQEVILALAGGHTTLEGVDVNRTLKGKRINILLKLSVIPGFEKTCSQVLVSIIDITAHQRAEYALQQSNKRYQSLFEDSPISIWQEDFSEVKAYLQTLRDQGVQDIRAYFAAHPGAVAQCADLIKVIAVNKAALKMYGAESKEELYQGLRYVIADESYQVFHEIIMALAEGRTLFEGEGLTQTIKGKKLHVIIRLSVIPGFEQTLGRVLVSIIDITARKQAEEALRKYEFITSASKECMTLINRDYVYEAANAAYCQAHLKMRDEVVGKTIAQIWGEHAFQSTIKKCLDQCFTGRPVEFEGWFRFNREDKGYYNVSYSPFFNMDGTVAYAAVVTHDITERKQAAEALLESQKKYRSIFENAPVGIFHSTLDGRLIDTNPEAARMMGYASPQELISAANQPSINKTLYVDPQFRPAFMRRVSAGQGQWLETEAHLRRQDGEGIVARMLMRQIPGDAERVEGFVEDITSRLRAEEEMRQLESQLLQAQKMEAIGTLAGGIAHDFNNILASLTGYTELALDDTHEGTEIRANLDQVLRACRRAKDLVKQILTFSRQDREEKQPVQVNLIVKEVLKFLRASLPATISIRQNLTAGSGKILADPTQVHQVLLNLCTNAAQAMEESGGVLDIALEEVSLEADNQPGMGLTPGPYLRLTVSDNGKGMAQEVMDRIFEPFFTTKTQGKGTGLGLAVVHGIVKSNGGDIQVSSEPGQGTTFQVLFPKIENQETPQAATPLEVPQGHERILVVDDEEDLADLWKETLKRLGYQVVAKSSSHEALEAFQDQPDRFDLVITDQIMPQMTGASLARELLRIRPDIPIILCTGSADPIKGEDIKALGIKELVNKPLSKVEIAVIIKKVLGKES